MNNNDLEKLFWRKMLLVIVLAVVCLFAFIFVSLNFFTYNDDSNPIRCIERDKTGRCIKPYYSLSNEEKIKIDKEDKIVLLKRTIPYMIVLTGVFVAFIIVVVKNNKMKNKVWIIMSIVLVIEYLYLLLLPFILNNVLF